MLRLPDYLDRWDQQKLNTQLNEHKQATKKGYLNDNIGKQHLKTSHSVHWDSGTCLTYSVN